ncbi:hypothetical protein TL16_g10584 [Triparma laevis f. inornata]|uniref:Uncharacterized protein n=1 Tax=Triparma laevis f. inornata TaxID=1714386 RepID=A0A9W7B9G4_9STRA|nr:hypothetical protein TL16_g10584 [Triparma laevis f. inornata]
MSKPRPIPSSRPISSSPSNTEPASYDDYDDDEMERRYLSRGQSGQSFESMEESYKLGGGTKERRSTTTTSKNSTTTEHSNSDPNATTTPNATPDAISRVSSSSSIVFDFLAEDLGDRLSMNPNQPLNPSSEEPLNVQVQQKKKTLTQLTRKTSRQNKFGYGNLEVDSGLGDESPIPDSTSSTPTTGNLHKKPLPQQDEPELTTTPALLRPPVLARVKSCESGLKKQKLILSSLSLKPEFIPQTLILSKFGSTLHKLSLSHNPLYSLSDLHIFTELYNLHTLDLSQCSLRNFTNTHINLPNLKRLDLSCNQFSELNGILKGCGELVSVDLYSNAIEEVDFGEEVGGGSRIENINLGYNNLSEFPLNLHILTELKYLSVNNNVLRSVSKEVVELQSLKKLDVDLNPISNPPLEVCARGLSAMRRFYRCLDSEQKNQRSASKRGVVKTTRDEKEIEGKGVETLFPMKEKRGKKGKKGTGRKVSTDPPGGVERSTSAPEPRKPSPKTTTTTTTRAPTSSTTNNQLMMKAAAPLTPPLGRTFEAVKSAPMARMMSAPSSSSAEPTKGTQLLGMAKQAQSQSQSPPPVPRAAARSAKRLSPPPPAAPTTNNTLKVIFVGDSMSGKTSTILRLKYGTTYHKGKVKSVDEYKTQYKIKWDDDKTTSKYISRDHIKALDENGDFINNDDRLSIDAIVGARRDIAPKVSDRTLGVEITPWVNKDVDFSVWDFAGQQQYHSTHELYFTPGALFVLCWDCGFEKDKGTENGVFLPKKPTKKEDRGSFDSDTDDSDSDEEDGEEVYQRKVVDSVRRLKEDVEEKVQFWIDCIQTSVPGAVILPVATFDDVFDNLDDNGAEAKRRTKIMMQHLRDIEKKRVAHLENKLEQYKQKGQLTTAKGKYLQKLLVSRPRVISNENEDDPVVRISNEIHRQLQFSGRSERGFESLKARIVELTKMKDPANNTPYFPSVGSTIPSKWATVKKLVEDNKKERPFIEFSTFRELLQKRLVEDGASSFSSSDLVDALHFFSDVGILVYFGNESTVSTRRAHPVSSVLKYFDFDEEDDLLSHAGTDDRDTDDESTSTGNSYRERDSSIPSMASTASGGTNTTPSKVERNTSSVGSTADVAQFIFLSPRWLMTACKGVLRHDLKDKLKKLEKAKRDKGIGDLYKQDTSDKIDYSKYYFLPSQLRTYDKNDNKDLFTFKLTPEEKHYHACLSHSFIHERPRFQNKGVWYSLVPANIFVYSHRIRVDINMVRDAIGTQPPEVVNQIITYVSLHSKEDDLEIGANDLGSGNYRLVVAARGLKSEHASNIFLGGFELFLRVTTNVLNEYSGLEYSREIFCPTCIQNKSYLWEVKSFEERDVMEKLSQGADEIMCSCSDCNSRVDIRLLLPEAAAVLAKKTSEMERFTNLQQQETQFGGDVLEGIVFLMVIKRSNSRTKDELGIGGGVTFVTVGTGFIVKADEGLIATAAHVVAPYQKHKEVDGQKFRLEIVVGMVGKEQVQRKATFLYTAAVSVFREDIDVAILKISTKMSHSEEPSKPLSTMHDLVSVNQNVHFSVANEGLVELQVEQDVDFFQLGSNITNLGFPQYRLEDVNRELYLSLTRGTVQIQSGRENKPEITIDIGNASGSSGGPVLNNDRKVIGIFSKSEMLNTSAGYMVRASAWRGLFGRGGFGEGGGEGEGEIWRSYVDDYMKKERLD